MFHVYFRIQGQKDEKIDLSIQLWRDRVEFVFKILMSLLIIYLFNPMDSRQKLLTTETKFLLYIYGFILLITADWSTFLNESLIYKKFQSLIA
jgi:hypothetical protein